MPDMPTTSHMPTFHRDQPLSDLSRAIIQYVAEHPGAGTTAIKPYIGPKPYCVGAGLGIYGPGRAGSSARGVV